MITRPCPTCGEVRCAVTTTPSGCACGRGQPKPKGESLPGPGFNMRHPLVEVRSLDGVPWGSIPHLERLQERENRHRAKPTAKEVARLAKTMVLQDRRAIIGRESQVHRNCSAKRRNVAGIPRLYRQILAIAANERWKRSREKP